ncbi:hypothetical protein DFH29DRAFT_878508 [Suillus ampliporus]|nr:hypothetical protein DFH29DRAFT_878508 [Suillus ampliporus]
MTSFAKFSKSAKKITPYLPRQSKPSALNQNHNVKKRSTPSIRAPPKTTTRQQSTPETCIPQSNHSPVVPRSPVEHCTTIQNAVASELSLELFKADQSDKPLAVERCRGIVDKIRGLNGVEHLVVSDLSAVDAAYILNVVGEDDTIRKRITFLPSQGQLTVKMPIEAHEAVLAPLTHAYTKAIYQMGHDNTVVQVQISGNTCFDGEHITGDPDMHVRVSSNLSNTSPEYTSVMITTVAFTPHGEAPTIVELDHYCTDGREMESVTSFNVLEATAYSCPLDTSEIAKRSRSSLPKSYDEWKPNQTKKNAFGPVISDGHTWIDVSMVNMHVWTRTSSDTRINVYQRKAGYAYGSVHPTYDVDDVDKLLGVALKRISQKVLSNYEKCLQGTKQARRAREPSSLAGDSSEEYVDVSHDEPSVSSDSDSDEDEALYQDPDEAELTATIARLRSWEPTSPIVNWKELKAALIAGIWNTGYMRYKSWHESLRKRDRQEAFDGQDSEHYNEGHPNEDQRTTRSMSKRLRTDI